MAEKTLTFRCQRCGHEWEGPYDPKVAKERACPACQSNSARPLLHVKAPDKN